MFSSIGENLKDEIQEIPVFQLNFYLMGKTDVDEVITKQIGTNIEYLNQEFEGQVIFELNHLHIDPVHAYIPDLHQDHLDQERDRIDNLLVPIEQEGAINVYLFETYTKDQQRGAMMGFTPVLSAFYQGYKESAPRFDRLFISYPGLEDMSTLVHEMGHFLGLKHPWELDQINLELMGYNKPGSERNHMTYHPLVDNFSSEQLTRMRHFALTFRSYLVSRKEVRFKRDDSFFSHTTPTKSFHSSK